MSDRLAAIRTPLDPSAVLTALRNAWLDKFGTAAPADSVAVLMGQIDLETGLRECICNNLGNIKSDKAHDYCEFDTSEVLDGRHIVIKAGQPGSQFRAFHTLDAGVAFYLDIMFKRFSAAWPAVRAGDPRLFAVLLKQERYYTADVGEYAAGLEARFNRYTVPPLSTQVEIASALERLGYEVEAGGLTDAVRKFQGDHSDAGGVDGDAGRTTKRAIRRAIEAKENST